MMRYIKHLMVNPRSFWAVDRLLFYKKWEDALGRHRMRRGRAALRARELA